MYCQLCLRPWDGRSTTCVSCFTYLSELVAYGDARDQDYVGHLYDISRLQARVRAAGGLRGFIREQRSQVDRRFPRFPLGYSASREKFVMAQCAELMLLGGPLTHHQMQRDGCWREIIEPAHERAERAFEEAVR